MSNMFNVTTQIQVLRQSWAIYSDSCPRNSGYCEDSGQTQYLVKHWVWRGRVIWTKILDTEEVPSFVWIESACYGAYYGKWKSKFSGYIT